MASGSASGSSSQSKVAQKTWEMSNNITQEEEIYRFDRSQHQQMLSAKPWSKDPHFFKDTKISALALLKMVMHARYVPLWIFFKHSFLKSNIPQCFVQSVL